MKSQILFSWKNKKNISKILSPEIFTQHAKCYGFNGFYEVTFISISASYDHKFNVTHEAVHKNAQL